MYSVSPMGQTPRSARSDHSSKGMWGVDKKRDDDDNEDIEEVMSEVIKLCVTLCEIFHQLL